MPEDIKNQLKKAYAIDAVRRDSREIDPWKDNIRRNFIELFKSENKVKLLELGAGTGRDSKYFQDNGVDTLAADLSPEMIEVCKDKNLNAVVLDFYDLSTLGQKFDGIYTLNSLLHVPRNDLDKVLENIYNILNDDGIFQYGVYGGVDLEETIIDKTKNNIERFYSFISDETLHEVVKSRFEIISFEAIDINSPRGQHFQSMLLRKR